MAQDERQRAMVRGVPGILPGNTVRWCGLALKKDEWEDCFRAQNGDFEWEVDATLNEDDEYEARLSFKGVKLMTGKGKTKPAALTAALQSLSRLESQIGNETFARRVGGRAYKSSKT